MPQWTPHRTLNNFAWCAFVWFSQTVTLFAASETQPVYERDIRPILRAHCFDCHGATDEIEGGLDLRLVRFLLKGGDSGPAIIPGESSKSLLLERIRSGEMPPGAAKVKPEELATLERWVSAGAPTQRPEPESLSPGLGITPEERDWWAFRPLAEIQPPSVSQPEQVRTPIDAFLLAKLESKGLGFHREADRATLIKRAYFDLLGLPPTAEEVETFQSDNDPAAWERLIDRLLESPHYGERWGRHWLDVAGYADSEGMTQDDRLRPYAYKYRDYVIRSFNADKPFDQFLVEQLAGDELVPLPHANLSPEQIEQLVATGFLRMAADGTAGGVDQDLARNQVMADTLKIVSTSLLGLSVACAQCHDHRYDPIPHTDYYALRAIFEPALDWKAWRAPPQRLVSLYTDQDRARAAEVEAEAQVVAGERAAKLATYMEEALAKELEKHPAELRDQLRAAYETPEKERTPEQQKLLKERPSVNINAGNLYQYNQAAADDLKQIDARIAEIRAKKPVEDFVRALTEPANHQPQTFLFHRGDHRQPKSAIAPGDLQIAAAEGELVSIPADNPELPTTGRRLAYARWLTNGQHPLVGRVLVNRFWMHHFGRGLVGTPSDFGRLGEKPSHPELLDWLARDFVKQGWSLKAFHKQIMLSTAYRQSSTRRPEQDAVDSDNLLVGRMPVRRLEAETVRDHLLAVTGTLDPTPFGPAIPVTADETGQVIVENEKPRRSVYVQQRRSLPVSFLTMFDAPVMETNCERRTSSTVAGQALLLMNNDFVLQQARKLAERVRTASVEHPRPELTSTLSPELQARLEVTPSPWQYGSGRFDENAQRVADFQPLAEFREGRWQGGSTLPDARTGWVLLHAQGGHTGENPEFAAIRRWVAPSAGTVTISGALQHPGSAGDGVRGRIISSRHGLAGEWSVLTSSVETPVPSIVVAAGDTIDFVTDCRESVTTDSFSWTVKLNLASDRGTRSFDSVSQFSGPTGPAATPLMAAIPMTWRMTYARDPAPDELELAAEFMASQLEFLQDFPQDPKAPATPEEITLQALTNLCQQLLSSNEFLYVD